MKYLALDIETWKVGSTENRPLGISAVCAIKSDDRANPLIWAAPCRKAMSQQGAAKVVFDLEELVADGYTIVSWNGLGFDFDVLAEESGMYALTRYLALTHIDMMFQFFATTGHMMKLDNAAAGMGVPGKLKGGMTGAEAPQAWQDGRCDEVIEYLIQDVRATMNVCEAVLLLAFLPGVANVLIVVMAIMGLRELLEPVFEAAQWAGEYLRHENGRRHHGK